MILKLILTTLLIDVAFLIGFQMWQEYLSWHPLYSSKELLFKRAQLLALSMIPTLFVYGIWS